jgi:hypothetical protein
VQAELLSTYAVELLPLERVSGSLRVRGSRGSPDPQDVLVMLVSLLFQVVGFVINAVMALIILTSVLSMVLGVLAWIARRFS